jgi:hypothetical protein
MERHNQIESDANASDFGIANVEKKLSEESFPENPNELSTQNILTIEDSTLSTAEKLLEQVKEDVRLATEEFHQFKTLKGQEAYFPETLNSESNTPPRQSNKNDEKPEKKKEKVRGFAQEMPLDLKYGSVPECTDENFITKIRELLKGVCL